MPEPFQGDLCDSGSFPPFVKNALSDVVRDLVYHLGQRSTYPKFFTVRYYWKTYSNGVNITQDKKEA